MIIEQLKRDWFIFKLKSEKQDVIFFQSNFRMYTVNH